MSCPKHSLDSQQSASEAQFERQSNCYGKSHILADTQDLARALEGVLVPPGGTALDVATGGGHTPCFWLARTGMSLLATSRRRCWRTRRGSARKPVS